jgi:hypothetical protein
MQGGQRTTSAAATIFPVSCGSRLTLRGALNVIFSTRVAAFADRPDAVVIFHRHLMDLGPACRA